MEDRSKAKDGTQWFFLVSWVDYDERTWEPEVNLPANLVAEFRLQVEKDRVRLSSSTSEPVGNEKKNEASDFAEPSLTPADDDQLSAGVASDDDISVDPGVDEQASESEYDVEEIHASENRSEDPEKEDWYFDVAWVGYEERSWEPEKNLPKSMVAAYRERNRTVLSRHQARTSATKQVALCPSCNMPDGLGSVCLTCKRAMHHFCASDVCVSLKIKDVNGQDMLEFPNDACYCSSLCYDKRASSGAGKRKRASQTLTDDDDDDDHQSDRDDEEYSESDAADEPEGKTKCKQRKTTKTKLQAIKPSIKQSAKKVPAKKKVKSKPAKKKPVTPIVCDRDPLVGKHVAFCADTEDWMSASLYKEAKGLYLSGRVFRAKAKVGERLGAAVYEIRWTSTMYQGNQFRHKLKKEKVEEGVKNFGTISGGTLNKASWRHICQVPDSEAWDVDKSLDDYVILDGSADLFVTDTMLPEDLEAVEDIKNLDFQPGRQLMPPEDLYSHLDGETTTRLIKEKSDHFATASSSFFSYLPIAFWKAVVNESNEYAATQKGAAITLDELIKVLGIMFYMTVVDKGEYSNYWGDQAENDIFGVQGIGLESVMSLKRFKFIRKNLCFRHQVSDAEIKKDPAARIRPLINMLKYTSTKYVVLGRNVAVDESSIACRSKYGRHLIVFNSSKPTGKFHFKIYACCCATTWLMVGFRLHCDSVMEDRLDGVLGPSQTRSLSDKLQYSSAVRQIVLEVTRPLHHTGRIVNTDNFYTSVQLLLSLRDVGLYGRGTVRESSAHFPKAHAFGKRSKEPRGSSLQGVSASGQMVAASWMDGSTVNIISSADGSGMGEVTRLIGKTHLTFPAPKCVSEYNQNMQGVDRLDQLRAKYSLADGHSMKKWHKKLALAFIDIARVNAFVTKDLRDKGMMADEDKRKTVHRNVHRNFMIELASEMISGRWKESTLDEGMLFVDETQSSTAPMASPTRSLPATPPTAACSFVLSAHRFPSATRGKRGCKVCAFEGRPWTMKTNYCIQHNVCLCTNTYVITPGLIALVCPHEDWSCWRKFHEYYLPRGLFNTKGRIKRSSTLHKARRELSMNEGDPSRDTSMHALLHSSPHVPAESPPTLIGGPFDGVLANAQQDFDSIRSPVQPVLTPAYSNRSSASTDYSGSYHGQQAFV
jgi:hypothetical protein